MASAARERERHSVTALGASGGGRHTEGRWPDRVGEAAAEGGTDVLTPGELSRSIGGGLPHHNNQVLPSANTRATAGKPTRAQREQSGRDVHASSATGGTSDSALGQRESGSNEDNKAHPTGDRPVVSLDLRRGGGIRLQEPLRRLGDTLHGRPTQFFDGGELMVHMREDQRRAVNRPHEVSAAARPKAKPPARPAVATKPSLKRQPRRQSTGNKSRKRRDRRRRKRARQRAAKAAKPQE